MLIESLRRIQIDEKLDDTKFAAKINSTYETWRRIRYGDREPGVDLLRGILAAYPDLWHEVLIFLGHSGNIGTPGGTLAHDTKRDPVKV